MAKISLNRKNVVSGSDISVDRPRRQELTQSFSFRWNNRRNGSAATHLLGQSNTYCFGHRGGAFETKSDIYKSTKVPSLATLFLRRSSYKDKPRTLTYYSPRLPVDPTLTTNRDARPVTSNTHLPGQRECRESCNRLPLARNLTGLVRVIHSPRHSLMQRPSDIPVSSGSDSTRSHKIHSKSTLPTPPIIISAPTPPDALGSANENSVLQHGPLVNSERKTPSAAEHSNSRQVPTAMRMLQSAARQLKNDGKFTEQDVFQRLAPITAFLYCIAIGVIMLKMEPGVFGELSIKTGAQTAVCVTLVISLGMLFVLVVLRGLVSVISKLARSFCELNLGEIFTRGIFVGSGKDSERLTETDFILGNLLTR